MSHTVSNRMSSWARVYIIKLMTGVFASSSVPEKYNRRVGRNIQAPVELILLRGFEILMQKIFEGDLSCDCIWSIWYGPYDMDETKLLVNFRAILFCLWNPITWQTKILVHSKIVRDWNFSEFSKVIRFFGGYYSYRILSRSNIYNLRKSWAVWLKLWEFFQMFIFQNSYSLFS